MSVSVLSLLLFFASAPADGPYSPEELKNAEALRNMALSGNGAWDIVESLTTEVGPRLAGTPGDRAAVAWGVAKLKELGFDKVWTEPVTFPFWQRGEEKAEVIAPYPQKLIITALGGSVATPKGGLQAEVVELADFAALKALPAGALNGKIAYIANRMERHITGKGYAEAVIARGQGASEAARKGAVGLVIRSVGTDSHRMPHTGVMRYDEDVVRIPAAALSNPDADLLSNMIRRGNPVVIKLEMTCDPDGETSSHNVIGEIRGREKPEEIVIIGGHLDSWDLGTGAIDDGAGIAITTEAARLISLLPQRPRRTLRVVMFANEESGIYGGKQYVEAHKDTVHKHMMGSESDFGAGRIYRFDTRVGDQAMPYMDAIARMLAPLGVKRGNNQGGGGPDLGPLRQHGMPVATLLQDGTDYFDWHHTPDDTLDKIDPAALRQNVACYAVFAYLSAEATIDFRGPVNEPAAAN